MAGESALLDLPTPAACYADFCLIPLGTPTPSVSKEIADVQRLLEKSGLKFTMHSAGTTVGEDVSPQIRSCILIKLQRDHGTMYFE